MTKEAILQGIAHNIAHHAGSGLSYISPYLGNALRASSLETTEIDLLSESPYPLNISLDESLGLSLQSLRSKAEEILFKHNFSIEKIDELKLYATPAPWDKDGYSLHTRVVIITKNKKVFDSGWLNEQGCT